MNVYYLYSPSKVNNVLLMAHFIERKIVIFKLSHVLQTKDVTLSGMCIKSYIKNSLNKRLSHYTVYVNKRTYVHIDSYV